ncbi:MAG: hypothetical protein H6718_16115 [Polyangiaceae bacterium]|nr:hypothetical protein [Polyangiaceae bacterium]
MPLRPGISNGKLWNTPPSLKRCGGGQSRIASVVFAALLALGCDVGESGSSSAEGGSSAAGASGAGASGGAAQGGAEQGGSGQGGSAPGGAGQGGSASGGSGGTPEPGCTTATDAAQPFGNHQLAYTSGAILPSHQSQAQLDQAVRDYYAAWKFRYLEAGCGDARAYVNVHNNGLTVSEAHGYGMLIAAFMAGADSSARSTFDGLFRYFKDHPSSGDGRLMAWKQGESCTNVDGSDSATDGDLDIAYALLLADKQWGSSGEVDYHAEALNVISGVRASEISAGGYLKLGDWVDSGDYANATRSSDVMPGHFASFAAASNDSSWTTLLDQSLDMFATLQANHAATSGLIPDFIQSPYASPAPVDPYFLENAADGAYGYNACRVPWRVGAYWLTSGDARAKQILDKQNAFIRGASGGDPWSIAAGYELSGQPLPNSGYSSLAYIAPFGVGAMSDATNQDWLNQLWDTVITMGLADEYYGDTLKLLSLIAMSGNWWTPAAAPCPDN